MRQVGLVDAAVGLALHMRTCFDNRLLRGSGWRHLGPWVRSGRVLRRDQIAVTR